MKNAAFAAVLLAGTILSTAAAAAVIEVRPGESINAALRRASAGDTVRVNPGTYREAVNINRDGVRLESATPGGAHIIGGGSPAVQAYGQSNIAVVGFRMTSSGSDGVKIGGSKHRDVQNITFTGNTLTNSAKDGFKFFQINGLRLIGNTIQNAGSARNGNGDGGIDFVRVDNALVQGNRVLRTYGHACLMMKGGSSGNRVIGNSFRGCERDGITVGGFTSPQFLHPSDRGLEAHNNEIVGNEVEGGPGKCPFYFRRAENNRIENNRLFGGRPGCNSGGGSNGPDANVDVSGAGSGDTSTVGGSDAGGLSGDLEREAVRRVAAYVAEQIGGDCAAGAVGMAATAVNAITGMFGGGRATAIGQAIQHGALLIGNRCASEQLREARKSTAGLPTNSASSIRSIERYVRETLGSIEESLYGDNAEEVFQETYQNGLPDDWTFSSADEAMDDVRQKTDLATREAAAVNAESQQAIDESLEVADEALALSQGAIGETQAIQAQTQMQRSFISIQAAQHASDASSSAARLRAEEERRAQEVFADQKLDKFYGPGESSNSGTERQPRRAVFGSDTGS